MGIAYVYEDSPLFDRKIENATTGLKPACKKILQGISKKNAVIIADYIASMQTKINPSDHYKKNVIKLLCKFSQWVGTYNLYRIYILRFFKWLYHPKVESDKRTKPSVVDNIPRLKRKEQSIYKPSDLWSQEDDLLFLRYCPSKRIKCYHTMSRDTGCRPYELLKLRIREIVFKNAGGKQYPSN